MLLQLVVTFSTVTVVLSQEILGLSYDFNLDFYDNFSQDKCDFASEWSIVDYESLGVNKPLRNTVGARSSVYSCATSFPVIFVSNSVLELVVYINTVSKNSGVTIVVIDENDTELVKYVFNRNSKEFVAGWSRINLPIDFNGVGYINLIGHSRSNEIILIDSFNYKIKTKRNFDDNSDENNFIFDLKENDVSVIDTEYLGTTIFPDIDDEEGSGGDKFEVEEGEEDVSLGVWAIALIAVGSATFLGMIVVGAYYLGKASRTDDNYYPFPEEIGPTIRIPRARSVNQSSIADVGRTWL